MRKIYRQGDILLVQVSKIPPSHREVKGKVLAYGEITGHTHRIEHGIVVKTNNTGALFVVAGNDTTLVHNEHGPITIARGKYQVTRQREYDPFPDGGPLWRAVSD